MATPARMPGTMAHENLTFVFGINTNSDMKTADIRIKGMRSMKKRIMGAKTIKSFICPDNVVMKIEKPDVMTITIGTSKIIET